MHTYQNLFNQSPGAVNVQTVEQKQFQILGLHSLTSLTAGFVFCRTHHIEKTTCTET